MDQFDAFYQQLDSEQLLKKHGPELVAEAREVLAGNGDARVAGVITTPDSREAGEIRSMLTKLSGRVVPEGTLLVGIVPRPMVESVLAAQVADDLWKEPAWEPQRVLPVVASTRDGFRFAFFRLDIAGTAES